MSEVFKTEYNEIGWIASPFVLEASRRGESMLSILKWDSNCLDAFLFKSRDRIQILTPGYL